LLPIPIAPVNVAIYGGKTRTFRSKRILGILPQPFGTRKPAGQFGNQICAAALLHRFFCIDVHLCTAYSRKKRSEGTPLLTELDRRQFLARGIAALGATWTTAHWPAVLAAAQHAHTAAASPETQRFEFFAPAEAKEVEAIASCIIPSDGTPGAREAGVVYFIDRALVTFSANDQNTYREGLPEIHKRLKELFPAATLFSAAIPEQQHAVLESLDEAGSNAPLRRNFRPSAAGQPLFEVLRAHTIAGFLIDPESDRKGNRGGVGWAVIGREPGHSFQPPFSAIDKDYPGWQPVSSGKEADKK
jgi:gluconate 2-dehydrogenase gamma chain